MTIANLKTVDFKKMHDERKTYLPAAGRDWALPFYDPMVKLLGADRTRRALINQAAVRPSDRILDIGCGTGTFAAMLKRSHPTVHIVGLDPDPRALARARRKADRASLVIRFDEGYSDDMPYPDASFDRIFSSFMFHHLKTDQREKTLREVRRVLAPGGSFHLLDFEKPEGQAHGIMARMHASSHLKDNSESRILTLMQQAGLASSKKAMNDSLLFGFLHVGYYQGCAP
jgi:ubiquinone/menaquinone biosynthesis C-methylase UbiE